MTNVLITIPRAILSGIFNECGRYDSVETGGRLLGFYWSTREGLLRIDVKALIMAGPKAQRTRTSFFQDGEYQESIFRAVEKQHPTIEHLGNWHTHHVNGLQTLSRGDVATYRRIVNFPKHNTDFFYSLLVTEKLHYETRYWTKHFILFRGDDNIYELHDQVRIVDSPVLQLAPQT